MKSCNTFIFKRGLFLVSSKVLEEICGEYLHGTKKQLFTDHLNSIEDSKNFTFELEDDTEIKCDKEGNKLSRKYLGRKHT